MTKDEFDRWRAVTASSKSRWTEDEIYRLNSRGLLYYYGGEDGVYMRVQGNGVLELGYYEGAIPHIGEAVFTPKDTVQHRSYNEAFKSACQIGGRQFKIDVFLWDQDVTTPTLGAPEMELGYGS